MGSQGDQRNGDNHDGNGGIALVPISYAYLPTDLEGAGSLEGDHSWPAVQSLDTWQHGLVRCPAVQYWHWALQFSHLLLDTDTRTLYLFVGRKSEVAAWRSAG